MFYILTVHFKKPVCRIVPFVVYGFLELGRRFMNHLFFSCEVTVVIRLEDFYQQGGKLSES